MRIRGAWSSGSKNNRKAEPRSVSALKSKLGSVLPSIAKFEKSDQRGEVTDCLPCAGGRARSKICFLSFGLPRVRAKGHAANPPLSPCQQHPACRHGVAAGAHAGAGAPEGTPIRGRGLNLNKTHPEMYVSVCGDTRRNIPHGRPSGNFFPPYLLQVFCRPFQKNGQKIRFGWFLVSLGTGKSRTE